MSTWQICKVHGGSRITCNPRGQPQSARTQSHTLFTTESDGKHSAAHAGFVYRRFLPERGSATHPAFQCCFGNRAPHSSQWEGRDYDMCVCVCELIKQWCLSGSVLTGGDFLISSLKEENTLGNNTGTKQTHTARPIKNQQSNLPFKGYEEYVWVHLPVCSCVCLVCCGNCWIHFFKIALIFVVVTETIPSFSFVILCVFVHEHLSH